MPTLYPLRLKPILKEYLWGGRRLGALLGKPLGEGETYAESWEAVDHPDGQSLVENGPLAGVTLGELSAQHAEELYGRHAPQPQFPLLLKYLDARKTLSVQVHPNDKQAAQLDRPDLGKTEAWLVVEADPGAMIYAGLKPGVDRAALADAVTAGECERSLHAFEANAGDCVFIPAGTVHAIGAGLVIAEIQQASNTTFRLFDWNRVGADGKPRALHLEEALDVTNYALGPVSPQEPEQLAGGWERLVTCERFLFSRRQFSKAGEKTEIDAEQAFRLLSVVEGSIRMKGEGFDEKLRQGQTVLLPAECGAAQFTSDGPATLIDARLP